MNVVKADLQAADPLLAIRRGSDRSRIEPTALKAIVMHNARAKRKKGPPFAEVQCEISNGIPVALPTLPILKFIATKTQTYMLDTSIKTLDTYN